MQSLSRSVLPLLLVASCGLRCGTDRTRVVDTGPFDADGDGYPAEYDCDDTDPTVHQGADEVCGDGVVNDCGATEANATAECHVVGPDDALATFDMNASELEDIRLAGVGDLDGDGHDDVALGRTEVNLYEEKGGRTAAHAGGIYLFRGPLAGALGPDDAAGLIVGTEDWDCIGWDLVGLGDTDGDGLDDFAVGASDEMWGIVTDTPAVYRVDGPADIASIAEATTLVQGSPYTDCLGSVMAAVPDQDGDGARDLLVGGQCAGEVHLLSAGGDETLVPGTDDLATFRGPSGESRFGHAMDSGDFDADGLADFAIGAPEVNEDFDAELGFVAVYVGAPRGSFSDEDADTIIAATPGDTTSSTGESDAALLGASVSIGDLDGDGYDDLFAGAPWMNDGSTKSFFEYSGGAYVFLGPLAPTMGIPDADVAILGSMELEDTHVGGEGEAGTDLDGDGRHDLVFGNSYIEVDGDSSSAGGGRPHAWLFFGPLESGTRYVTDADVRFEGGEFYGFGHQVRVAGDTNGDCQPELLIGSWGPWLGLFEVHPGVY